MAVIPDSTIWLVTMVSLTPSMILVAITLCRDHQNEFIEDDYSIKWKGTK